MGKYKKEQKKYSFRFVKMPLFVEVNIPQISIQFTDWQEINTHFRANIFLISCGLWILKFI